MPKVRKSILPIPVLLILWRNDLNFFGLYSIKSSLCHRVTTNKPLWLHHWLHDIFRPWTQTQAHHITFCAAVESLDWQVQTDYNFAITITIITKYRKTWMVAARCIGNKFQLQIRKWLVIYTQMPRIVLLVRWFLSSASSPVSPSAVLPLWLRGDIRVYLGYLYNR